MKQPTRPEVSVSLSELKANPIAAVESGKGFPVAVLIREKPEFYCVPADFFEAMIERIEEQELVQLIESRQSEQSIPVKLEDL